MKLSEKEWFIQVPWGRLCVVAWGSCMQPPVLLVHGVGDNAACFAPLVRLLPDNFYYVGIELPGVGRSDRLPQGLMITTNDLLSVINIVATHFRWESFGYIGHGLGGILGKLYNHSIPGKINKLVELDPINFIAVEPGAFAQWYHTYFTEYYKNYRAYNKPKEKGDKFTRAEAINKLMKRRGLSAELAASIVDRATDRTADGYLRSTWDARHGAVPPPPLSPDYIRSALLAADTPTLHVLSSRSCEQNKFRNTAFLQDAANYPHGNYKCLRIEGTHDLHMHSPEKVASVVGRFLLEPCVKAKL